MASNEHQTKKTKKTSNIHLQQPRNTTSKCQAYVRRQIGTTVGIFTESNSLMQTPSFRTCFALHDLQFSGPAPEQPLQASLQPKKIHIKTML